MTRDPLPSDRPSIPAAHRVYPEPIPAFRWVRVFAAISGIALAAIAAAAVWWP